MIRKSMPGAMSMSLYIHDAHSHICTFFPILNTLTPLRLPEHDTNDILFNELQEQSHSFLSIAPGCFARDLNHNLTVNREDASLITADTR